MEVEEEQQQQQQQHSEPEEVAATVTTDKIDDENVNDEEEQKLYEEFKVWKKNTPFLYDLVVSRALEWPSLTVEWVPGRTRDDENDIEVQRLILGTHTNGEDPNYLLVAEVHLPLPEDEINSNKSSSTTTHQPTPNSEASSNNGITTAVTDNIDGDFLMDARGRRTRYQNDVPDSGKSMERVRIIQKILHPSEVNRARCMPQRPSVIATKGTMPEVYIFDTAKHPAIPTDSTVRPDIRLTGHKADGYGLDWSPVAQGWLASGSNDNVICLWDVEACGSSGRSELAATGIARGHEDIVEDVAWHKLDGNVFGSVGDDGRILLWDKRDLSKPTGGPRVGAHGGKEVNAICFSPFNGNLFVTGGSDNMVMLWDIRDLSEPLNVFMHHTAEVYQVAWSRHSETILASSAMDKRVLVWDLSLIGDEQSADEANDGPPELLFTHSGHTGRIAEFSWSQEDPWLIGSVADDNIIQLWQMSKTIYSGEDDIQFTDLVDKLE